MVMFASEELENMVDKGKDLTLYHFSQAFPKQDERRNSVIQHYQVL